MDPEVIASLQNEVMLSVTSDVTQVMEGDWSDREWVHIFVDFEIDKDVTRSSSISFSLARLPGSDLEKVAFRLSQSTKHLFGELAAAMTGEDHRRWSSAQLRIEKGGRYSYEFSHDRPLRLGGLVVDDRFRDYLDRWILTDGGARLHHHPPAEPINKRSRGMWSRLLKGSR